MKLIILSVPKLIMGVTGDLGGCQLARCTHETGSPDSLSVSGNVSKLVEYPALFP
ncbi:MAG: hypothetical protein J6W52_10070 [Bacteroidaceae bacterium]|nr:hypothetical protein [Bacteroidaceae bacterium]